MNSSSFSIMRQTGRDLVRAWRKATPGERAAAVMASRLDVTPKEMADLIALIEAVEASSVVQVGRGSASVVYHFSGVSRQSYARCGAEYYLLASGELVRVRRIVAAVGEAAAAAAR